MAGEKNKLFIISNVNTVNVLFIFQVVENLMLKVLHVLPIFCQEYISETMTNSQYEPTESHRPPLVISDDWFTAAKTDRVMTQWSCPADYSPSIIPNPQKIAFSIQTDAYEEHCFRIIP